MAIIHARQSDLRNPDANPNPNHNPNTNPNCNPNPNRTKLEIQLSDV